MPNVLNILPGVAKKFVHHVRFGGAPHVQDGRLMLGLSSGIVHPQETVAGCPACKNPGADVIAYMKDLNINWPVEDWYLVLDFNAQNEIVVKGFIYKGNMIGVREIMPAR